MMFQIATLVLLVIPLALFLISYDALSFRGRIKRLSLFVGFDKDIMPLQAFLDKFWNRKLLSLMMTKLPMFDGLRLIVVVLVVVYFVLSILASVYAANNGISVHDVYLKPTSTPLPNEFSWLALVLMFLIVLTIFVYFSKGHILKDIEEIQAEFRGYKERINI